MDNFFFFSKGHFKTFKAIKRPHEESENFLYDR